MIEKDWFCTYRILQAASALGLSLLTVMCCEAATNDSANDAFRGPSGTLAYQGVISGGVTFPSADCTFDRDRHLLVFMAPHQDEHHPELDPPGPLISVSFLDPGAMVQFGIDQQHPTNQTVFMRMQQKDGVSYAKKGGNWVVTITGLKMPNLDVMNQQWATLSGTFVCTHLINPQFAE